MEFDNQELYRRLQHALDYLATCDRPTPEDLRAALFDANLDVVFAED